VAPRQRAATGQPSARQLSEQDWQIVVTMFRLLTRLTVEALKHHRADDADTLARQGDLVEQGLEHVYSLRWARLRPALLHEQAAWLREEHGDDPISCQAGRLQHGIGTARIDVLSLRRLRV
jgi:hypothetical protein